MKAIISFMLLVGIILMATFCSPKKDNSNPLNDFSVISVDINNTLKSEYGLSKVLLLQKVTPLETSKECLIGSIDKLQAENNRIFVLDRSIAKKLFVFNDQGSFLFNLGIQGKGPFEFSRLKDFCVDKNYIYLVDGELSKVSVFNISDGNPVKEYRTKAGGYSIQQINDDSFIIYDFIQDQVSLTNKRFEIQKILKKTSWFSFMPNREPFCKNNGIVTYNSRFSDTVWQVSESGLRPYRIIDFGKRKVTMDDIRSSKNFDELQKLASLNGYCRWINNYHETDSIIYFSFVGPQNQHEVAYQILIDKSSGHQIIFSTKNINDILNTDIPTLIDDITEDKLLVSYNYLDIEDYCRTNLKMVNENNNPIIFTFKIIKRN